MATASTTCPCGRTFEQPRRRGRRYVYCETCRPHHSQAPRPSRDDHDTDWLRSLPDLIDRCEAAGCPVVVEHDAPLPEHVLRLYSTLGVRVRFTDSC